MITLEERLTRGLELILALCLLAIAAIVITLVVMRYAFNSSITGANELVTVLFVYATSLGAAVALGRREHIAISFAVDALPTKTQATIDLLSYVLVAFLNAVLVVESFGWIHVTGGFLMPSTGLPRIVAQLSVPLGCGLAVFYCLLRVFSPVRPPVQSSDVAAGSSQ